MPITYNDKFRIRRSKQYDTLMKKVSRIRVFEGYPKLLLYSALFGYVNKAYSPFVQEAENVQLTFFQNVDRNIMDCLAFLFSEGRRDILTDKEGKEKYMCFSYYANGGFPILMGKLEIDEDTIIDDAKEDEITYKLASILIQKDFRNEI
jgi:hypothetical protein